MHSTHIQVNINITKTVLITSTLSVIGPATVDYFSQQGSNVVAGMRKPKSKASEQLAKLNNVVVVALDVTSEASIKQSLKAALSKFGTIDALLNNPSYGLSCLLQLATIEKN